MPSQPLFEKGPERKAVFEESLNAEPSTPNVIKILVPKILWLNKKILIEDIDQKAQQQKPLMLLGVPRRPLLED